MAATDSSTLESQIRAAVDPPTFPDREFPITDFGAEPGIENDASAAIEAAIRDCSESGGGRVLVPEGTFHTGAVHLLDGVELHLVDGATLAFSRDPADFLPVVETRWEGTELRNYSPFIYAYDRTDVAITGDGTIDGRADDDHWWPWCGMERYGWEPGTPDQGEDQATLELMAADRVPVAEREFGDGHYLRPNLVQPYRCENVLIEGVTLTNSPMWMVHPVLCENVTVRDITVDGDGPNNDGCNPESCRDVVIRDSTFFAGDDCIALKSGREADGRRLDVPCENVLIEGCELRTLYGAITMGSELSGGIRNVLVRDCRGGSDALYFALYIKTNARRGGFVENLVLEDVTIDHLRKEVISCDFHRGEGDDGEFTPRVEDVTLRELAVEDARGLGFFRGFDRSPIRSFRLEKCSFENLEFLSVLENANIEVADVTINGVTCHSVADIRAELPER